MSVKTKADLDQIASAGCQAEGCDHADHGVVYLHGRCHPGGRIEVSYRAGSGVLRIGCLECGGLIAFIRVGDKE